MKTTAALATVVITIFPLIPYHVSATPQVISASVLERCQTQLSEEVALCKLQAVGAEECFLEAVDHANECTSGGNPLAQLLY
jgi:hypothetical protein